MTTIELNVWFLRVISGLIAAVVLFCGILMALEPRPKK